MDLYRVDSETYKVSSVYQNELELDVGAISPDGRFIALSKNNSNKDSDTYILDTYKKTSSHNLYLSMMIPHNIHLKPSLLMVNIYTTLRTQKASFHKCGAMS